MKVTKATTVLNVLMLLLPGISLLLTPGLNPKTTKESL
jgi:hypothetical protein